MKWDILKSRWKTIGAYANKSQSDVCVLISSMNPYPSLWSTLK